jgi:carbonic anhydrase
VSLRHDTALVRRSPGTPRHVHIYGFLYDIDRDRLELVVDDPPSSHADAALAGAAQ